MGSPAEDLGAADSLTYYAGSTATGTPLSGAPKDAGTYTVKADFNGNTNYEASLGHKDHNHRPGHSERLDQLVRLHLQRRHLTPLRPPSAASALLPRTSVRPTASPTTRARPLRARRLRVLPTNAGTYTVKADFNGNTNYGPASNTKTITIAQANATVSINWTDSTYNGTPNAATATVSGIGTPAEDLGAANSLTYYAGSTATGTPLAVLRLTPALTRSRPTSTATPTTSRFEHQDDNHRQGQRYSVNQLVELHLQRHSQRCHGHRQWRGQPG